MLTLLIWDLSVDRKTLMMNFIQGLDFFVVEINFLVDRRDLFPCISIRAMTDNWFDATEAPW